MNCGNDPNVRMTPGDLAVVTWFREWLTWSHLPVGERGPEPVCPDGRAINMAARAQTTACTHEGEPHD